MVPVVNIPVMINQVAVRILQLSYLFTGRLPQARRLSGVFSARGRVRRLPFCSRRSARRGLPETQESQSYKFSVAVTRETGAADAERLIILDAKYRIEEGLNNALNSIHTYRDALVHEVEQGAIAGIVSAAYLLTPHVPELREGHRNTPMPVRLFHPQYRSSFKFTLSLRNSQPRRRLSSIFAVVLIALTLSAGAAEPDESIYYSLLVSRKTGANQLNVRSHPTAEPSAGISVLAFAPVTIHPTGSACAGSLRLAEGHTRPPTCPV